MKDKVLSVTAAAKFAQAAPETIVKLLETRELAGRRIDGEWRTTRRAVLHYIDGGVGGGAMCCCPPSGEGGGCCSGLPGCC